MKRTCKIGDIFGRGNERLVVVGIERVMDRHRSAGVVYTVQKHTVAEGDAEPQMLGGTELRTTRSCLKAGGWKFVSGPTFEARESARMAAEEAGLAKSLNKAD